MRGSSFGVKLAREVVVSRGWLEIGPMVPGAKSCGVITVIEKVT